MPESVRASLAILRRSPGAHSFWAQGADVVEDAAGRVVAAFDEVGARWCLVGAHAVGVYVEPRATVGFDFVFDDRKERKLLAALERAFGQLAVIDIDAALRLPAIDVDLIRASSNELFSAALEDTVVRGRWRVPSIEVLLALKFLSATSRFRRRERRIRDAADLASVYRTVDSDSLDREKLMRLAAKVFPGAERELADWLERIDRGEPIAV
jgi:hypothetical protein